MARNQPEAQLQKAVVEYIRWVAPRALCFAVPNGGKRSKIEASIFKSMGVMPGVADLLLFWSGKEYPYLRGGAIELKAGKGKQSEYQIIFESTWAALGGKYAVCTSIEEVEKKLKEWGIIATVCPPGNAVGSLSPYTARPSDKIKRRE